MMKKPIIIVGFLIIVLTVVLVSLAFFVISKLEAEKNNLKTQPARAARWATKPNNTETTETETLPDEKKAENI